jgi:methyl-accepting chemotaxis protein
MKAKKCAKSAYSLEVKSENGSRNASPVDGLAAEPLVPLPVVQLEQAAAAVQPVAAAVHPVAAAVHPVAAAVHPVAAAVHPVAAAVHPVAAAVHPVAAAVHPVAAAAVQPVAAVAVQPVAVAQNDGLHEAYRQYCCQQQPARYGDYYQQ